MDSNHQPLGSEPSVLPVELLSQSTPTETRTPVFALRTRDPRPLDDGGIAQMGFEPMFLWLKARDPGPLDDCAEATPRGIEPLFSTVTGWWPFQFAHRAIHSRGNAPGRKGDGTSGFSLHAHGSLRVVT